MPFSVQIANVALDVSSPELTYPDLNFEGFMEYSGQMSAISHWKLTSATDLEAQDLQNSFETHGSWSAHKVGDKTLLNQYCQFEGQPRELQSSLLIDSKKRECYLRGAFQYPFDELLFILAFSEVGSQLIHSCAVEFEGKGYVFCGVSGAGKSTLSEYLQQFSKLNVLCDERNVITFDQKINSFYLSSTPWAGTSDISVPKTLPLNKIFILDPQHKGSGARELSRLEAYERLYQVCFFPQFDKEAFQKSHDNFERIIEKNEIKEISYQIGKTDLQMLFEEEVFLSKL